MNTFYLWDLADTLFIETWQPASGFADYSTYLKSLGFDPKTISPEDFEWAYERPYKEGLMDITLAEGFKEILSWTKNNSAFTTGNKQQLSWRAVQLKNKDHFDILPLFTGSIYSTFDYGNSNVKTAPMYEELLNKIVDLNPTAIVYTDNHPDYCRYFIAAAKKSGIPFRCYNMRNDNKGLRPGPNIWQIGSLYDMLKNEQALNSKSLI